MIKKMSPVKFIEFIIAAILFALMLSSCLTTKENGILPADKTDGIVTTDLQKSDPVYESVDNNIRVDFDMFTADDEIKVIKREDGIIRIYPVLGPFLQPTGYSAYMFCTNDGTPLGVQIDKRDFDTEKITASTISDESLFAERYDTENGNKKILILDNWLFLGYKYAIEKWPGAELVAFLQNNRILVRMNGNAKIATYNWEYPGEPEEMQFDGSKFETVAQGRELARTQVGKLNELAKSFGDFYCPGDAYLEMDAPDRDYYIRYGKYVGKTAAENYWEKKIPSADGSETYIIRLFFNRYYEPVAEVVYEKTEPYMVIEGNLREERTKTYKIIFEHVGNRNPDGTYAPLETIKCLSQDFNPLGK